MAYNKRWSVPCLLLAALALLACGTTASEEVVSDVTTPSGQQFDTFVFTVSTSLPKNRLPVALTVQQPVVTGGGLTLTGWDDNSLKGEYAFTYIVDGATVTDSSLAIRKAMPADGIVTIRNTQAQSTVSTPVFDFSAMAFTGNLTMEVRNSVVGYSGAGVDSAVMQMGSSAGPTLVSDHTSVQVIGMRVSGGSCVVRMAAPATNTVVMSVTEHSLVGLDSFNADGVSRAALCLDTALYVSVSSVVRVTDGVLTTATVGGVSRSPKLVVDTATGSVSVSDGSMFVLKDVSIADGGVLGSTAGALVEGTVTGGSIVSMLDIDAAEFCPSCSVQGYPTSKDDTSYVYAQDWTMDGTATDDYADAGLGDATDLNDLRDSSNNCRSAYCLPANANAIIANAESCSCNCKEGTFPPMCLDRIDATTNYVRCDDAHCVTCGVSPAFCSQCAVNYEVDADGKCIVVNCAATNCAQCTTTDADVCARCNSGYGLVNGQCEKCDVTYCQTCDSDASVCTGCMNGYTISNSGKTCSAVSDCQVANCAVCVSGNVNRCATCEVGYGLLSNGQCSKCTDANCELCSDNVGFCTECSKGYTLTSYGTCSPGDKCLVEFCAYCKVGNTESCATCISGYDLNTANGMCVPSGTCLVSHCSKCALGNPNFCQTCESHYSPDWNGVCQPVKDPNCRVSNCLYCLQGYPKVCQVCLDGYAVTSTGKCGVQGWCKVAYCTTCQSGNPNRCKTCFKSFSIRPDGTCYPTSLGASAMVPPYSLLAAAVAVLATIAAGLV